ncbi:hypothetical protein DDY07_18200 [Methylomonas sp. ZR1]|nr:hypothetical protein [Methylomonas sp. ZR1]
MPRSAIAPEIDNAEKNLCDLAYLKAILRDLTHPVPQKLPPPKHKQPPLRVTQATVCKRFNRSQNLSIDLNSAGWNVFCEVFRSINPTKPELVRLPRR